MKVTALLPEKLIEDVKHYSNGKNLTESLVIALHEWVAIKKIRKLNEKVSEKPLQFNYGFSPEKARNTNRTLI